MSKPVALDFAVIPGLQQETMPRKSARLLSKSKSATELDADDVLPKRRKTRDGNQPDIVASNRKQQFRIQNARFPISDSDAITTSMIVPHDDEVDHMGPTEPKRLALPGASGDCGDDDDDGVVHIFTPRSQAREDDRQYFRFSNHINPLPAMDWAESQAVWQAMKEKEQLYSHSPNIFANHPTLTPHMRAILLSWLTEVCDVYKLHRETFYMAVEFVDRFLASTRDITTGTLQLLGITALFIASKVEEIYPPKAADFAYVADGAFDVAAIHQYELYMVKTLKWQLCPVTANTYAQLYLQLLAVERDRQRESLLRQSPHSSLFSTPTHWQQLETQCSIADLTPTSPILVCDSPPLDSSINSGVSELIAAANVIDLTNTDEEEDSTIAHAEGGLRSCRRSLNTALSRAAADLPHVYADENTMSADEGEEEDGSREDLVLRPRFSPHDYLQMSTLLDLVTLDVNNLRFKKRVLAAAALFLTCAHVDVCRITGLEWEEVQSCISWMQIHKGLVNSFKPYGEQFRTASKVPEPDAHLYQGNTIPQSIWEEAEKKSENFFSKERERASRRHLQAVQGNYDAVDEATSAATTVHSSPNLPHSFITPPRSVKKSLAAPSFTASSSRQ